METLDFVKEYSESIDKYLKSVIDRDSPLSNIISESLMNSGKKIRPLLLLLSYESVSGKSYKFAIPLAAIYELAHTAALIQDDMLDNSPLRRNKITLWKKYGKETALLVSDFLLFEIFGQLTKYNKKIKEETLCRILKVIEETSKKSVTGEFLDIEMGKKRETTIDDYIKMVGLKTGSLLAGACKSGAILGNGNKKEVKLLEKFGENTGIAYQIKDDILDVSGNEKIIGKPIFQDIKNSRNNLVVIYTLGVVKRKDRNILEGILNKKEIHRTDMKKVTEIFKKYNAIKYAEKLAEKFSNKGRELLKNLKNSKAKEKLIKLSYYAERRMS